MAGRIYVAKNSFWTHDGNGDPVFVAHDTRIREGHPLLEGRMSLFKEIDALEPPEQDDKPDAKRAPGRPASKPKEA